MKVISMSTIKVFAKAGVDLREKVGTYSCILDDFKVQRDITHPFKKPIKTLTQADCMAYVNALFHLSLTAAAVEVQDIEIFTDSGKVGELFQAGKAEKHCKYILAYWINKIKPVFVNLQQIKIVKVGSKPILGDSALYNLNRCQDKANKELLKNKDLTR